MGFAQGFWVLTAFAVGGVVFVAVMIFFGICGLYHFVRRLFK